MTTITLYTPVAYAIGDTDPDRGDWLTARRQGIGGSDIPAIVGVSAYKTAREVYHEKTGDLDGSSAHESARWGTLFEDIVAQEWADRHRTTVETVPMLANVNHPWRLASLDRLVTTCPDSPGGDERRCLLEVKTRSAWKGQQWNDDVPDDVLAQVQWYLHVTGLDHAHVAALIGGQRLVEHRVESEPPLIDWIVDQAAHVWQCVLDRTPPVQDPSALLTDLLNRLFPDREGQADLDPDTVAELRQAYRDGAAIEKDGRAMKEAARDGLVALLDDADTVTTGGLIVATYKPTMRTTVDTDRLRADYPQAFAACVTKQPTTPVLRWKDPK